MLLGLIFTVIIGFPGCDAGNGNDTAPIVQEQDYTITTYLQDDEGNPLSNADVVIEEENYEAKETDEAGTYIFEKVELKSDEEYTIKASKDNHTSDRTTFITDKDETIFSVEEILILEETEEDKIIEFEDPNLEEAVREEINKPEGDIHLSDVLSIKELEANEKGIGNITDLEYLTNLESLLLNSNNIEDITALENLNNLEYLMLGNNNIEDISALENLKTLETLGLYGNNIKELTSLVNLTNLEWLNLHHNKIEDITPLVNNQGFGSGDYINLLYNYLDLTEGSKNMDNIQELIEREVDVAYEYQEK